MSLYDDRGPLDILRRFAPGTRMREAIDRVIQQGTGALVMVGWDAAAAEVCSGGFVLGEARFSPQRLAELAKMDGGIVVDDAIEHIIRANVQFIPDPEIPTSETGTRHRTGERLANQLNRPVVAVSEGRHIAIVYTGEGKHELRSPDALMADANQILNSLERFRRRLADAEDRLTRLEVDDLVHMRDVVVLVQRAELVHRLNDELNRIAIELGREGHLLRIQATDLTEGVDPLIDLVYNDYSKNPLPDEGIHAALGELDTDELYDAPRVAAALGLGQLDVSVAPRGFRALSRVPRLPESVRESLIDHFGSYQKMLHAPESDLAQVEGVGRARARQLRSYFDRLLQMSSAWDLVV